MTKQKLIKDMEKKTGSSFITITEICKYLGLSNQHRVKTTFLADLDRVNGKLYFIPDVAEKIMESRNVGC